MSGQAFAVSALSGFIAGVTLVSVVGWAFRERIRAAMIRRRHS